MKNPTKRCSFGRKQLGDLRASSYHLIFPADYLYLIDLGGGVEGVPRQGRLNLPKSLPSSNALLDGCWMKRFPFRTETYGLQGFFHHDATSGNSPEGENLSKTLAMPLF